MNFEYKSIGAAASTDQPVSLLRLATNVVTDWMPGTPNSLARGFTDLLGNIIKAESTGWGGKKHWIVQSEVNLFEKQWKSTSSWILGVAFCRKVIEMEGYRFWAPVSAFTPAANKTKVAATYWEKFLEAAKCLIRPVPASGSNLLPDYIIGRINSLGVPEISFAESKGSRAAIANLPTAPPSWSKQSRNAEFTYGGIKMPATQNLVVATRFYPKGVKNKSRKIQVRAWNARDPDAEVSFAAFRALLVMHYYGVCQRIGMETNAELMALGSLIETSTRQLEENDISSFEREKLKSSLQILREEFGGLTGRAKEEIQEISSQYNTNYIFYGNTDRPAFTLGNRAFRVGLNQTAMDTVRWLQGLNDNFSVQSLIREAVDSQSNENQASDEEINFFVRNDGVVGSEI